MTAPPPPDERLSASEPDTRAVAAALARQLMPGTVVLLYGDLGAGKTAFVRGLAEGLAIAADEISSPTFTLAHEYLGGRLPLVHVDLYRLGPTRLDEVGFDPDVAARGVLAVEWAERLAEAVPGSVVVRLTDAGGDRRRIAIERPTPPD